MRPGWRGLRESGQPTHTAKPPASFSSVNAARLVPHNLKIFLEVAAPSMCHCPWPTRKSRVRWPSVRSIQQCGRQESNLHGLPHGNLNPARLPVPPRPQRPDRLYHPLIIDWRAGPGNVDSDSARPAATVFSAVIQPPNDRPFTADPAFLSPTPAPKQPAAEPHASESESSHHTPSLFRSRLA